MNQKQAEALVKIVGGEAWNSGGGIWLVTVQRGDGRLIVFSGDAVCEYENEEAFDEGRAAAMIGLVSDLDERWVVSDAQGNTFYEHDEFELGWASEGDARREALALSSRTGERYFVREQ